MLSHVTWVNTLGQDLGHQGKSCTRSWASLAQDFGCHNLGILDKISWASLGQVLGKSCASLGQVLGKSWAILVAQALAQDLGQVLRKNILLGMHFYHTPSCYL